LAAFLLLLVRAEEELVMRVELVVRGEAVLLIPTLVWAMAFDPSFFSRFPLFLSAMRLASLRREKREEAHCTNPRGTMGATKT